MTKKLRGVVIYITGGRRGGVGFDAAARQLVTESARQLAPPITQPRRACHVEGLL